MLSLYPYLSAIVLPLGFEIVLAVWKKRRGLSFSIWRAVGLFACCLYLTEVLLVTGLPSLSDFLNGHAMEWFSRLQPSDYNLQLFHEFEANRVDLWLNIFLFVPLGIFVPALWLRGARKSRAFAAAVLSGFLFSAYIEFMQLWNYRFSDVNDLFCNTVGALCGGVCYLLFAGRRKKAPPQAPMPRILKAEAPLFFLFTCAGLFLFYDPYLFV